MNEWQDDWPTFFARHRLQAQLDLIEKDYADREARELWSQLQVGAEVTPWDGGCPFRSPPHLGGGLRYTEPPEQSWSSVDTEVPGY